MTTPQLQPDMTQAKRFIDALWGHEKPGTYQLFDDQKKGRVKPGYLHGPLKPRQGYLVDQNRKGAGIFIMVNRGDGKGRSERNVTGITAVFVDLDGSPIEPVKSWELTPHVITQTSEGRYQAFWRVDGFPVDKALFGRVQTAMQEKFHGDAKITKDLCRVMRVPGFYHMKREPFLSQLVEVNSHPAFTSEQLFTALGIDPKSSQEKVRKTAKQLGSSPLDGFPNHERNDGLFTYARELYRAGRSDDEVRVLVTQALANSSQDEPFSQHELDGLLKSAAKYGSSTEAINLTDMGNAERMARLYGDRIRFCKHLGWLVYDGPRWATDDLNCIQGWAKETIRQIYAEAGATTDDDRRKDLGRHAMRCESASRIQAMTLLLPSEPGIAVSHEAFDTDKMLLNVRNGTVDLRTGMLRPHNPEDMITKLAPVTFDPDAKAPRWEQFILEIMDNSSELADFLQRFLGYCLTGATEEHVWAFLYGKGANGKSTLLRVLMALFGDYAVGTPTETFLVKEHGGGPTNDLARLRGARLIVANELPQGRKFNSEALKYFSGEDQITARFLHKEFFEFYAEGKLVFSGNKKPTVHDSSEGFWRRPLLVPFLRQFQGAEKDPKLTEKLNTEAPGILTWLVQGCLMWQNEGLNPPATIQEAVQEYRSENDVLADFLEQHCLIGPDFSVAVADLYPAYKSYADENHVKRPLNKPKFNEDLNSRAGITQVRLPDTKRTRIWRGIGLRQSAAGNVVQGDFVRKTCSHCALEGEPCPKPRCDRDANKCQYFDRI